MDCWTQPPFPMLLGGLKHLLQGDGPLRAPASGTSFWELAVSSLLQQPLAPSPLSPPLPVPARSLPLPCPALPSPPPPPSLQDRRRQQRARQLALRAERAEQPGLARRPCFSLPVAPVPLQLPFPMNHDRHASRPVSKHLGPGGLMRGQARPPRRRLRCTRRVNCLVASKPRGPFSSRRD